VPGNGGIHFEASIIINRPHCCWRIRNALSGMTLPVLNTTWKNSHWLR